MRSVGCAPTQLQVDAFVQRVDGQRKSGLIRFDEFIEFVNQLTSEADSDEQIKEAFRYLDKEKTGFVNAADLRRILTSIGDLLTQDEVGEMLKEAEIQGNLVSFDEFLFMMRK